MIDSLSILLCLASRVSADTECYESSSYVIVEAPVSSASLSLILSDHSNLREHISWFLGYAVLTNPGNSSLSRKAASEAAPATGTSRVPAFCYDGDAKQSAK